MGMLRYYLRPGLSVAATDGLRQKICTQTGCADIHSLSTELCFYVELKAGTKGLAVEEEAKLQWILGNPFDLTSLSVESFLEAAPSSTGLVIEMGPRLNFCTAFSTNATSICHSVGLTDVIRIERSTRYAVQLSDPAGGEPNSQSAEQHILQAINSLHDRMTECRYSKPVETFQLQARPEAVYEVDVIGQGKAALEKANKDLGKINTPWSFMQSWFVLTTIRHCINYSETCLERPHVRAVALDRWSLFTGLAFDAWDLDYYTTLFCEKVKRNPTSVECFDLAQSNSEHSRHWFFKGRMVVDGTDGEDSLFSMVMKTQEQSNPNNVIKFSDNSSAIHGFNVKTLYPTSPGEPCAFQEAEADRQIIFTAETHNFPTGVAPFPGATTGTGGRIRDVQATGQGAHVVAGTAGYSFGNLNIPGYQLPWEDSTYEYPANFASPLDIAIQASNGASDYGNKFGEPVLTGFARSFGMTLPNGERREWVKPIMFSGGIGSMEKEHIAKDEPTTDMMVVKVGGPVYRIGVGGGAASSIQVQGDNEAELDFGAVQRGDAEMEQKMNRVIRACIERRKSNPIRSIHDQGAGGNGNVLKEISEPVGATLYASQFQLGDPTLSVLEIWGAEYQESNAMLVAKADKELVSNIATREKCAVSFVGEITGDGKICLEDDRPNAELKYPVDLELEHVLGSMPRKVFHLERVKPQLDSLNLPQGLTVKEALDRVLRLPSVASKRYLTNKVDRSVTGLVAQQQCVGPLHTPLADVAVTALSHFSTVGSATAIGEQPIKGLLDPCSGARMTVGEALTNLVFARITELKDVKCSGNWMWAAKLPGEGAALYDTCAAMCNVMQQLGIAVDGGKDSLSMAARVGSETVKAPGTLVVSVYAACPDITATVTPDLKCPQGKGVLLYVGFSRCRGRLGGSALAQCYQQLGDSCPDLDDTDLFTAAFNTTQKLIEGRQVCAGHDVSDGGLITCLLEMAFAGNHGLTVAMSSTSSVMEHMFGEDLGIVIEVQEEDVDSVTSAYQAASVPCEMLGYSQGSADEAVISIKFNSAQILDEKMVDLRDIWEETSFQLERHQTTASCVKEEAEGLSKRRQPPFTMTFDPKEVMDRVVTLDSSITNGVSSSPRIAVIREEGSNGDREMASTFHMAGFEVWDVNMQDLCSGAVTLDSFRGIAFVGGFSYADVCGSAKGWAATIKFSDTVRCQFDAFRRRDDTFSLGVCNGCQLMGLLGWVAPDQQGGKEKQGVHVTHNISERYESRFVSVCIEKSPSVMLQGMEGSVLGVWVAHGEGRMLFKDSLIHEEITSKNLAPLKYVDDDGKPTMQYPLNPNGSVDGIAAICSDDGRHLAMMPHPERCVLPWQWPWMPSCWRRDVTVSPWLAMFKNAYDWCLQKS